MTIEDGSSTGDSNGCCSSSADHAINEEFQFQLTATLPASETLTVLTITMTSTLVTLQ